MILLRPGCLLPLLLLAASPGLAQDGKALYEQNCAACHIPDQMVVGPSLIEISKLYRSKPDDFLAWAKQPKKKRPGLIEMPPMGHLGDANLLAIREHMIKISAGLKEKKAALIDPVARPPRRPEIQRMFLPNVGPAAIAVALPGDLSYCFDAGVCELRLIWSGGFIDAWPYWAGNGGSPATIDGKILWQFAGEPSAEGKRFRGYTVDKEGIPTFEYERGGARFREKITASGHTLTRAFAVETATPLVLEIDANAISSAGARSGGTLTLSPKEALNFSLTLALP